MTGLKKTLMSVLALTLLASTTPAIAADNDATGKGNVITKPKTGAREAQMVGTPAVKPTAAPLSAADYAKKKETEIQAKKRSIPLPIKDDERIAVPANQAHVGKKACVKGAFNSGGDLLKTCVEDDLDPLGDTLETETKYDSLSTSIDIVPPEVATQVKLSASDVNRIVCPGDSEVKDAIQTAYSREKGIDVKVSGKNVFVKFKARKTGSEIKYTKSPAEMFIICGDRTYNIIAFPERIPSKTIRLSGGPEKAKKNNSLYGAMPYEKKIVSIIKNVYTGELEDSYTVRPARNRVTLFEGVEVTAVRNVIVEGEGLTVKEFRVTNHGNAPVEFSEKNFLKASLSKSAAAISVDKHKLKAGDSARLFIVERRSEG